MKKTLIKKTITILIMLAVTSFSLLTGCSLIKELTPIDRAIARRITTVTLPEASPQNVKLEGEFTEEQLEKFNEVYNLLLKMSIYDIDHEKMMEAIIAGMSSVFDAYTMYVPEEHAQSIRESSSGEYKGIGVTIVTPEDGIGAEVVSVNPTGDAYVKGVKPGDIIIKVEDMELTKSMSLEYIASMVKGEEGTYVNITIWRPSEEKEIQFNIMRMLINTIEVTGKMIEGTDIGHVYISSFSADMLDEFVDIFNDLVLKQGMKKLVLDLRDNPGGDFYAAVSLADAFIEEGVITTLADGTGYEEEYTSDSYAVSIPTVILVNENSASASELFSGAMKHYGLATIVGTQTFGKGVAQSIYDLDDGSQLRVTSYQFLLPDDTCIDGIGITPDVEVLPFEGYEDAYVDSLELEHDAQLQKAIEILESK
ncbi:MAG TPA: S41 family peptidase [Clostridia bacterium]|nr:S41 family peptidase [Clostridia bacterium]HQC68974.1 S41 family peptidase [Clostridia bacterium]